MLSGSPSGSLSLASSVRVVAVWACTACVSSTASGAGLTGVITTVPTKLPPLPSSTVTGTLTGAPALSTGGVPLSTPVAGS